MSAIVLIPARLAATRLPRKPLADIGGLSMIVRVLRQAEAAAIGPVAVAAGDVEIVEAVRAAGGQAILTDPNLPSGSDRIKAALDILDPKGRHEVVINLQGDIPFVEPALIRACADVLVQEPNADLSTLAAPEASAADRENPDVVKVIMALPEGAAYGRALYFTRSRLYGDGPVWHHPGVYGYRPAALRRFTAAPPSPLERREKLEQLRALELGMSIWAAVIDTAPISVDTPEDLEAARAYAKANNL